MEIDERRLRIERAYQRYFRDERGWGIVPMRIGIESVKDFTAWLLEHDELLGTFVWRNVEQGRELHG